MIDTEDADDQARDWEKHIMTVLVGTLVAALGALSMRPVVRLYTATNSLVWLAVPIAALTAGALTSKADGTLVSVALGFLAAVLVALSEIDLKVRRLPREISYPATIVGVTLLTVDAFARGRSDRAVMVLAGAAAFSAAMLALYVLGRGALGEGDVRVAPLLGSFLGYWSPGLVLPALLVASLAAALVGLGLMTVKRTGRNTTLPFGPFLALGTAVILMTAQ